MQPEQQPLRQGPLEVLVVEAFAEQDKVGGVLHHALGQALAHLPRLRGKATRRLGIAMEPEAKDGVHRDIQRERVQ